MKCEETTGEPSPASTDNAVSAPTGDPSTHANGVPAATTIPSIDEVLAPHDDVLAGFDPAIHAVDADGQPKRKAGGGFALKRGRKAGSTSSAAASALPPKNAATKGNAPSTSSAGPSDQISSEEMARQSANMCINAAVMLLGDEWEPKDKAEAEGVKIAFKNYYDVAGVPNFPPWFGLVMALGAYSLPRIHKPTTKERITALVMKVRGWIGG